MALVLSIAGWSDHKQNGEFTHRRKGSFKAVFLFYLE